MRLYHRVKAPLHVRWSVWSVEEELVGDSTGRRTAEREEMGANMIR